MQKSVKRKTALFFSDIVGYSKMIARDESHMLDLLNEHDIILEKEIKNNNGTIIKHIGDAVFAEFPSINKAAEASVSIQKELAHRNTVYRGRDQFNIRIGLHQGDVVEKDGDLFGNDVNLCSRIENIALSGSIAISDIALKNLEDDWYTHEYGRVKLKNIPVPQVIHRLYIDKKEFQIYRHEDVINQLIELNVSIVDADEQFDEDIQTVAVMYPQNLGKPEDEFLCYSFLEQVITDLQKIDKIRTPNIFEVSRYKNNNQPPSEIALKLSVSNIVQLNIINTDDQIKINMCLTSMDTGEELLNESWTGRHNDQRKIAANLISKMADTFNVELSEDLKRLFDKEHNIDNVAYKKYLEGKFLSDNMTHGGDLNRSEKLLEEAINIDDEFAEAYSAFAMTKNLLGNYEDAEESLETALDLAEESDNQSALMIIYNNLGIYYKERQKFKKSIRYFEKGIKLLRIYQDDLMEAKFLHNMAGSYARLGDNNRALDFLYKAQKIYKKLELSLGNSYGEIGARYKDINNHDEAITSFNRAIQIFKAEGKSFKVAMALVMQSDIYNSIGKFNKSIAVLDNAVLISEDFQDELMDGRIMSSYAIVYHSQKKYNEAIKALFNAIDHFQNMNRNNLVLDSMMKLIQIYIEISDIESAKSMYKKCKKISRRVNDPIILSELDKLEENIK